MLDGNALRGVVCFYVLGVVVGAAAAVVGAVFEEEDGLGADVRDGGEEEGEDGCVAHFS